MSEHKSKNLFDYFVRESPNQNDLPQSKRPRISQHSPVDLIDNRISDESVTVTSATNEPVISSATCTVALSSSEVDSQSDSAIVLTADSTSSRSTKTKIKDHVYLPKWAEKWSWLLYRVPGGMFCTICEKHKKTNAFTSGCTNYRTSTLERHCGCKEHREAVEAEVLSKDYQKASTTAVSRKAADPMVCSDISIILICQL